MTPRQALAFVRRYGVVLQAARGPVPNLAEAVAGERIRGSWWGHPRAKQIFDVVCAVCESRDVLLCKLVDGKTTYVHRRLWPAVVRLASRLGKPRLARVWNEHTATGAHRLRRQPFPAWVPDDVATEARELTVADAEALLPPALLGAATPRPRRRAGRR